MRAFQNDRMTLTLASDQTTVLDPTMLELTYVGAGANAATVEITSAVTDITAGQAIQLQAVAKNPQGQAIAVRLVYEQHGTGEFRELRGGSTHDVRVPGHFDGVRTDAERC